MVETTLGVKNTTWATIELASAGLLAAITLRSTCKDVKKAGGVRRYIRPNRDSWKSATSLSNILIAGLLLKAAIDAAKAYNHISGINAAPQPVYQLPNSDGQQNYF